jgi:hypothetical protein
MKNTDRLNLRIRFQPTPQSHLGQVLEYLKRRGYDIDREVKALLIVQFLPFALRDKLESETDRRAALLIAHDCIGQLSGMVQAIQAIYQVPFPLFPAQPPTQAVPVSAVPEAIAAEPESEIEKPRGQIEDSFRRMFGD